jgi:NAD-dependent dihydropyrimidine dehydrogenase PreA subunit
VNFVIYILSSIFETFLRLLPFPTRTGLVRIGSPDRTSPVLLTGNYHLTVQRVKRSLKGINAYLLVANSGGINVWCAATGGLLTNHDVISVLKTSGIEELVDHRNIILPQLSATGIESGQIHENTGWRTIFGPVYIRDIKEFLASGKKSDSMKIVRFDFVQRVEMALSWAFPLSLVPVLFILPFWPHLVPPVISIIWGFSLCIFLAFPLYSHRLDAKGKRVGLIFFDFRQGGFLLVIWALFIVGLIIYSIVTGNLDWGFILPWCLVSFVVLLLLSIDLMGSTPHFKSGLHEDRLLHVNLDKQKCRGAGFCQDVCPRGCFLVDRSLHTAHMPLARLCVQCGACIVQCPFDALSFVSPDGKIIYPEIIRKFKLNLMGKRYQK